MPRNISQATRNILESQLTGEGWIVFITISHQYLDGPIRVANDIVNYTYKGIVWIGFPFKFSILSDDERPPRGKLTIQNVDRSIGEAILQLSTPPSLRIEVCVTTDFNQTVDVTSNSRLPIGTPTPWYVADNLFIRNVSCDIKQISGDVGPLDISVEPWPAIRCTKNNTPALFV